MENNKQLEEIIKKRNTNVRKALNIIEKKKQTQYELTKQVFSEVYDVIYNMEIYNEIPKSFIELVDSNRDKEYQVKIDYTKSLKEQDLQKGTRVILALMYRDYLCSKKERQILLQKDNKELKKIEQELKEQYNIENIFKNKQKIKNQEQHEEKRLIVIQERKWYQKIFDLIKEFFERN